MVFGTPKTAGSDANVNAIHDHEGSNKLGIFDFGEKTSQSILRLFNRRWPNVEANDAVMLSDGKGALIGKVFVEGDDDRSVCLSPAENLTI